MTNPLVRKTLPVAYVTPEAFAQRFGVSKMTIYRLMHDGTIKWLRVGRSMRIPMRELQRFENDAYTHAWEEG